MIPPRECWQSGRLRAGRAPEAQLVCLDGEKEEAKSGEEEAENIWRSQLHGPNQHAFRRRWAFSEGLRCRTWLQVRNQAQNSNRRDSQDVGAWLKLEVQKTPNVWPKEICQSVARLNLGIALKRWRSEWMGLGSNLNLNLGRRDFQKIVLEGLKEKTKR
eukprot:CAMPEP_0195024148 /NCGR_PEP_ID=MMETSP0326_2-20130528/44556_1 /TAXON_ID=2866 ORGANISM="Crypthecodinium cohnii, Strain Seligo" /NCGR_SAMPLE_ID=MMETSP0326_2 /ASSEMBLY_ACC=CAM_ASM_000348 /LENGTH=158 /DNA_ID=CAMNT_0040044817 /DNA_START=167 /DNA_END=641 /DNA_ORIENTATION=-